MKLNLNATDFIKNLVTQNKRTFLISVYDYCILNKKQLRTKIKNKLQILRKTLTNFTAF